MQEQLKNQAILEAKNACLLASQACSRDRARQNGIGADAGDIAYESPAVLAELRDRAERLRKLNEILAIQVRHFCSGWKKMSFAALELAERCLGVYKEGTQILSVLAVSAGLNGAGLEQHLDPAVGERLRGLEAVGAEHEDRLLSLRNECAEWDKFSNNFLLTLGEGFLGEG